MSGTPIAPQKPHTHSQHGTDRYDPYHWLRDDERKDPEVLAYLEQENRYTDEQLQPTAELQETLYQEMIGRLKKDDDSVPYFKNGYWYQSRYSEEQEYPRIVRFAGTLDAEEELLLDANQRAEGFEFYSLGSSTVSPDGKLLAFSEDTVGRREYVLYVKDLSSGEFLLDKIEQVASVVWANDNKTLYYVKKHPTTLLPYQVYRHTLGTSGSDELIYEEKDDTFYTTLYKTTSEDYIVIGLFATVTSEVRLLDANQADAKPRLFLERQRHHEYDLDHLNGRFYLRSNRAHKNFALYSLADTEDAASAKWQTEFEGGDEVYLDGSELLDDYLVLSTRSEGLTQLQYRHWNETELRRIAFDDPAYTVWLAYNPNHETTKLRYAYTSLTTPMTHYETDLDNGQRVTLKQQAVLGDFSRTNYASERIWITARDGVKVPVSLVYRKGCFSKDGHNPLLVYGYGSYGNSMDPYFSPARLSLLDRGMVYAIAHIRGGEELGRQWYENGKLLNKKNTFNDFVDATRCLLARGYGDRQNCFAMGGSAGGLLMGAVINQAPELYKGVVAQVPFVDVVSTMLDDSIPLTTGEYDEWGNPHEKKYFDYILSYSPYDQVKAQDYPNMLVTTGLHDSQVQYWEPAKWVAKLRKMKTDDNLLLLKTDMDAGHGGKSGRFKQYQDTALEYGFILWLAK
ncbi:MAG: S9 family peptidase [Thiolinea sp.]